jgi:hypothetical protein
MFSGQYEQFESNMREFIRTELETGITFASIALDSKTEEKRQRSCQNARKAYDTAMHFWKEHLPEESVTPPELLARLNTLRDLLLRLGETIEE